MVWYTLLPGRIMMNTFIAPWLINSKVSPPRISINVNRREALIELLRVHQDTPVILLEAPAGFGKTLLLSQWREQIRESGIHVAWLSIEPTDQSDILLPYMAFAFHHSGLDATQTGLLAAPAFSSSDFAYSLGRLLGFIENSQSRCVLILDDFENTPADVLPDINRLLHLQPGNLQLVFACRQNPGLALSGVAVAGNVLTIGPQQLMFSQAEVRDFFANTLAAREIDNIMEKTDGWPVALQLIRTFGTRTARPLGDAHTVSVSSRLIAGYFREQLFAHLSVVQQSFLRQTSILDVVTVACADHIRGSHDAGSVIQGLQHLGGIFSPLEYTLKDTQEAYRLHPLVREYLRQELIEAAADEYAVLNKKAAAWMLTHERGLDAMRYALAANDGDYAAAILEQMGGAMLWIREGMSRLTSGLKLLDGYELKGYPRIQLARSLLFAKTGRIVDSRQAFARARVASKAFTSDRPGGDNTLLQIEGAVIKMVIAEYGCVPANRIIADEAFSFVLQHAGNDPLLLGYIKTLQCLTSLQYGEFDDCLEYGAEAIARYLGLNSLYGELYIYFYFGMAALARLETDTALIHYNKATQMTHSAFPGDTGLKLLGNAVLAEFYWERGDTVKTKKYIRHVIKNICDMEAYFEIYTTAYQTAIFYLLFEQGAHDALDFMQQARERAIAQSLDRLVLFLSAAQVSILYFIDEGDAALKIAQQYSVLFAGMDDGAIFADKTWREVEAVLLALVRLSRLTGADLHAETWLQRAYNIASRTDNRRLMINVAIQTALNHRDRQEQAAAVTCLAAAVQQASQARYLRPFLNEYRHIQVLLAPVQGHMQAQNFTQQAVDTVQQLINYQPPGPPPTACSTGFSAREVQILSVLSKGYPDKLIARQIGLTAHGVRYHLKSIYQKMGVENRTQAIRQAHEMRIV